MLRIYHPMMVEALGDFAVNSYHLHNALTDRYG
jgi:hypothetical protein